MKRMIAMLLAAVLSVALCSTALAETSFYGVSGAIVSVNADGTIEAKKDNGEIILFRTDANTLYIDRTGGGALQLSQLKAGMRFYAWHSMALTASLPAQSYLHTLITATNEAAATGHFYHAVSVQSGPDGITLLNEEGDLYATIPANVALQAFAETGLQTVSASSLRAGATLLLWYDKVAKSYPGQTTVTKALLIKNGNGAGVVTDKPVLNVPATGARSENGVLGGAAFLLCLCVGVACLRLRKKAAR